MHFSAIYSALCYILPNCHAGIGDILEVSTYLKHLDKEELKTLGKILGLSHATVTNHFDSSLQKYRDSILEAWLFKRDKVEEKGGPRWTTLETALRDVLLRHTGIADKIHRK